MMKILEKILLEDETLKAKIQTFQINIENEDIIDDDIYFDTK